eukprot:scaffold279069_cov36-Tisochrysis_lutea.AAC.1
MNSFEGSARAHELAGRRVPPHTAQRSVIGSRSSPPPTPSRRLGALDFRLPTNFHDGTDDQQNDLRRTPLSECL